MLWAFAIMSRYFASLSFNASRIFFLSEISVTTTVPPFFASSGSMSRAWRVQATYPPPAVTISDSANPFPRGSRWIWRSRQTCPNSSSLLKSVFTGFPRRADSEVPRRAASGWLTHAIAALRIWKIPSGVAERIEVSWSFWSLTSRSVFLRSVVCLRSVTRSAAGPRMSELPVNATSAPVATSSNAIRLWPRRWKRMTGVGLPIERR